MPSHDYRTMIGDAPALPTLAPGQAQEITEPRRVPSVRSDVIVPLWTAITSAAIYAFAPFVVGGIALYLFDAEFVYWKMLFLVCALVFAIKIVVAWDDGVEWVRSTVDKLESLTGADINGDGYIPPHAYTVKGRESDRAKFDPIAFERARLQEFIAYAYANGTDTPTLRSRFRIEEINRFRALLMQPNIGCAIWKSNHHNQGWAFVVTQEQCLEIVGNLQWEETKAAKR